MTFVEEKADADVLEALDEVTVPVEIPMDSILEVSEVMPGSDVVIEKPQEKVKDWINDGDHSQFLSYLAQKIQQIPRHSGETTIGCEKALAFLRKLDREISKAIQTDDDNVIDEHEAEKIREQIMDFIAKLEDAHVSLLDKKTKKYRKATVKVGKTVVARLNDGVDIQYFMSIDQGEGEELLPIIVAEPTDEQVQKFCSVDEEIVKEATYAKVHLFEDPFLHSITRMLINSHVSAGRNIEEVYDKFKKKYAFTPREELSIHELLLQKGFPIYKDFGRLGEDDVSPSDGNGINFSTSYYA